MTDGPVVVGVDGCHAGWFVVTREGGAAPKGRVVATFADVLTLPEHPTVIAVDVPIGLLDHGMRGGRVCDREARAILGWPRCCSVFSPPVRSTLGRAPYATALRANRRHGGIGISRQAFAIMRKIEEVDQAIVPADQDHVFEVHPEVCFAEMAGHAMRSAKSRAAGRAERVVALQGARDGFTDVEAFVKSCRMPGLVARDDVLDAMAACWSAARLATGNACALPSGEPPRDARGLAMQIWR